MEVARDEPHGQFNENARLQFIWTSIPLSTRTICLCCQDRTISNMSNPHDAKPAIGSKFTVNESLAPWNIPAREYIVKHHKEQEWDGLATANVVFNSEGKVLILQRASHDSMPNKWELPGGGADDDDPTILHGAARELLEEAGLVAKRFTHIIPEGPNREPGQVFPNSTRTKTWCRFTFHAEIEDDYASVTLDSNEHQHYVWASEEEVRNQKIGDRDIIITRESMRALILEAFRLKAEWANSG